MNDKLKPLSENINKEKFEKFTKEYTPNIFENSSMTKYVMEYEVKIREQLEENILCAITQIALENGIKYEYAINKEFVVKALEKQIPKKVIKKNPECYARTNDGVEFFSYDYYCPLCADKLRIGIDHHCQCGQTIDWSDSE